LRWCLLLLLLLLFAESSGSLSLSQGANGGKQHSDYD
jgi:hypothetical protein